MDAEATADAGIPAPRSQMAQEELPLGAYAALSTAFLAAFTGSMLAGWQARGVLPAPPSRWDVVTAGAATHKHSRLLSREKITTFIREPFVVREGADPAQEAPQGQGLRRAI